jgi:site-specific DNA-cytosine methylase
LKVLSLFDGIGCGRVALDRAGVPLDSFGGYHASEIDRFAMDVSHSNYPDITYRGDIRNMSVHKNEFDLVMGGSPCQGFSLIGKRLDFEDPRSLLFFDFIRILNQATPKYFLFENVMMRKEAQDAISSALGFQPHIINSSLLSGQNRVRLYWTNIPVEWTGDLGISMADALGYSHCIGAAQRARYINGKDGKTHQVIELRKDDKANAITTAQKNCMLAIKGDLCLGGYYKPAPDGYKARYLEVEEAEKLMGLPVGYTKVVKKTRAHKLIGNGWSVDVIAHILKGMDYEKME